MDSTSKYIRKILGNAGNSKERQGDLSVFPIR
jgi:hypothetical protein